MLLRNVASRVRTNKQTWGFNSKFFLSSEALSDVEKTWSMFPEYKIAAEHLEQGNFTKALPALERVYDVLESAMGKTSPVTTKMVFKIADSQRYSGQFDKSITTLNKLAKSTLNDQIIAKQLISINLIQQRKFSEALTAAKSAVELCENQNPADSDTALFSSSYTMKGLKLSLYHACFSFYQSILHSYDVPYHRHCVTSHW